jgi:hypothetical protein
VLESNRLTTLPESSSCWKIDNPVIASIAIAIVTEAAHLHAGLIRQWAWNIVRVQHLTSCKVLQSNDRVVRDQLAICTGID